MQPVETPAIAEAVGKKSLAVKWQLEELVNAGYLTKQPSGRKVGGSEVMEYGTTEEPAPAQPAVEHPS